MRLLLDADALAPPLTGVGHYVRHLADGLAKSAHAIDLSLVQHGRLVEGMLSERPARLHPVKRLAIQVPGLVAMRNAVRIRQMGSCKTALSADVYHEPNHTLRATPSARVVLTIHDLSVLHHPHFHPPARVRSMAGLLAPSAARADMVITVSEFTKRDVVETLGIDPLKVCAIPLGVGPEFRLLAPESVAPVLARYRLQPGGYLLALGTREPRKNLGRLIDCYMAVASAVRHDRPLVLVGPEGWRSETLERRIRVLQKAGHVRLLGYVPDTDRPGLYAGAAGFAYPSLFEGFGLPPLEAAACGVPVLTSLASPMADVLVGLAILVDPWNEASIGAGLERLLMDDSLADRAREAAPAIAARYTWAATVESTIGVYRDVLR